MTHDPNLDPHWFSFVHLSHFKRRSCTLRSRYILLLFSIGLSVVWMLAEIAVGINLILNKDWTLRVLQRGLINNTNNSSGSTSPSNSISLSSPAIRGIESVGSVAGWVVLGSTALSICAMLWDWIQARAIVESDSIPRAFLNTTAFRLWSVKSYAHYCLLANIDWGRGMRQWIVTAVYFGLQGFMSALVTLPRLFIYGCILFSVKWIPDLALSAAAFEWLQLNGFSALRSGILKGTLIIVAMSTLLHTLYVIKILIAVAMCICSFCCLGRLRKAMNRDLKTSGRRMDTNNHYSEPQHEAKRDMTVSALSPCEPIVDRRNTETALSLVTEKDLNSQDSFHAIDLNADKRQTLSKSNQDGSTFMVNIFPPSTTTTTTTTTNTVPSNMIKTKDEGFSCYFSAGPSTYNNNNTNGHSYTLPTSSQPIVFGVNSTMNMNGTQSTWDMPNTSAIGVHGALNARRPSCQSDTNHLIPGGRVTTTLSFYDDLLKSISNERMIYASSRYNRTTPDLQQLPIDDNTSRREPNNLSMDALSNARRPSIPLTFQSCSEYDNSSNTDRPVHPFDNIVPDHSTTLQTLHQSAVAKQPSKPSLRDLYIHPLDALDSDVAMFNNFPQQQSQQEQQSRCVYNNNTTMGLSRSGSSKSQETIENWRIHVEPRAPAFHALDYEMGNLPRQKEFMDEGHDEFGDSVSRRGTIPIILSSHIEEAAVYQEVQEQDLCFSADDLHLPRPFYAYGQTRTQRQGSVNSSIGGYNYSIASSPSLADSLSNPMYQQQSLGITSPNSAFPYPFPPRKCSLPSSIHSSVRDETISSVPSYLHNQITQSSHIPSPNLNVYSIAAARTKIRTPSHLSNMVVHDEDIHIINANEHQRSESIRKKTHQRSQSQGTRSSGRISPSPWDQLGHFNEVQASYASMIDIPPVSRIETQTQSGGGDLSLGPHAEMVRMNNPQGPLEMKDPKHKQTNLYTGTIPQDTSLDLSTLLSDNLRDYSPPPPSSNLNYTGSHSRRLDDEAEAEATWNEIFVGLGLTISSDPNQGQQNRSISDNPSNHCVPSSLNHSHHNINRKDNEVQATRPNTFKRLTSGMTTVTMATELSDATTLTGSYHDHYHQSMAKYMTDDNINEYERDMTPYQSRQLQTKTGSATGDSSCTPNAKARGCVRPCGTF
ncbi:hypothetical protein BGZ65_007570 [Modicella reniformis]|uniref:Uncharacterized protein n=1 Tax=Modicella reniformis TaxID=1440133 RepID=A0A9P6MB51_9FUNG|nr:hypothetical protein BGZ65_007570 [Modicella reniformis]